MATLFCHDLVASEHNGGESRVRDALEHSTLCLFRILIDKDLLRYFGNNDACCSVCGGFVSVGHVFCTWQGQKSTALISATGLARSCQRTMQRRTYHQITIILCLRSIGRDLVA